MNASDVVGTLFLALFAGLIIYGLVAVSRYPAPVKKLLQRHFGRKRLEDLTITGRKFHARIRADLQRAIDQFFVEGTKVDLACGIHQTSCFQGVSFSGLLAQGFQSPPTALEYEDVDIGEDQPVRCAIRGLWLLTNQGRKYAVVMSPDEGRCDGSVLSVQVAAQSGDTEFAERLFTAMEKAVREARSYRGKVLSLESGSMYTGQLTGIKVEKLPTIQRAEIILSQATLDLLERNVVRFVRHRSSLANVGQSTKKGLLFYGPPGNGKTHTIRYLAAELKGHTTLLITAGQAALLGEYMVLARLLQPSLVVIEDVDLIARDRTAMDDAWKESMLNRLLNEMDGLKPDAEILFILTTNRPCDLERALAARPGRIDQAIEFALPDDACRARLIRLYSRGITVSDEVVRWLVSRTDGTSASFIKELMRRSMLSHLERADEPLIEQQDVEDALQELLGSGSLNLVLLRAHRNGAGD